MNMTLARLSTGRFIDLAAIVAARPYLQDGKLEGNGPHQGISLYLTGGHQVTLIGPEAEDMIGLLARTRLLVDHLAKPNPVPAEHVPEIGAPDTPRTFKTLDDFTSTGKPQRPPGHKGGEAVKLHGYTDGPTGRHYCPACATHLYPDARSADVRPVFGTPFDQDTYRCSHCGQVC